MRFKILAMQGTRIQTQRTPHERHYHAQFRLGLKRVHQVQAKWRLHARHNVKLDADRVQRRVLFQHLELVDAFDGKELVGALFDDGVNLAETTLADYLHVFKVRIVDWAVGRGVARLARIWQMSAI